MTGTPWPLLVVVALLGLAIGSFLNVVIYRVPRHESVVAPPSHCPKCDSLIKARHNVPVLGWLVLRGRCAVCALPISIRYPTVEAVTAAAMVATAAVIGLTPLLPLGLVAAPTAITLAMIGYDAWRPSPTTRISDAA